MIRVCQTKLKSALGRNSELKFQNFGREKSPLFKPPSEISSLNKLFNELKYILGAFQQNEINPARSFILIFIDLYFQKAVNIYKKI